MRTAFFLAFLGFMMFGCSNKNDENTVNIVFLHHSTGQCIWDGKAASVDYSIQTKTSTNKKNSSFSKWLKEYNKAKSTNYIAEDQVFPKNKPYGWANFPYDYYNIWVKNAGESEFNKEPTLEILTKNYHVIIFKHCFPVSNITADTILNIESDTKSVGNYKLQYNALKEKLHQFPNVKFILWTGSAQVKTKTNEDEALRAKDFFGWVKSEWDEQNDNIFIWDFRSLQTEDGLYFEDEYSVSPTDSHPNKVFSEKVVSLFAQRVVDVIENNGSKTNLKGEFL